MTQPSSEFTDPSADLGRSPSFADERRAQLAAVIPEAFS
jgi:hypothetical protein